MNVLLPVDGSDHTKRMLAHLAARDELLGPGHTYTLFTAVAPIPPHAARFLDRSTLDDYYHQQVEQVFAPIRAFAAQNGWALREAHAHGAPAEAIADHAKREKTDLIVMGTHGHSALANVVLGSVASGVLARTRVPVLLVR